MGFIIMGCSESDGGSNFLNAMNPADPLMYAIWGEETDPTDEVKGYVPKVLEQVKEKGGVEGDLTAEDVVLEKTRLYEDKMQNIKFYKCKTVIKGGDPCTCVIQVKGEDVTLAKYEKAWK